MKVSSSVRTRCDACIITKRKRRVVVKCRRKRRHNQRQG